MEPLRVTLAVELEDETQVSVARRGAASLAERLGLSAEAVSRAELVAVELAGNVLHHATRGMLLLGSDVFGTGLQLIATDKGPGIGNLEIAKEDGFSTRSTPGLGLGAIERQLRGGQLGGYSQRGGGTVFSAVICEQDRTPQPAFAAVISTCIAGETVNGDCWTVLRLAERAVYVIADGLGHGLHASEAALLAIRMVAGALSAEPEISLTVLLNRMHGPMRSTRGAAIALVSVNEGAGPKVATCCGVGNISVLLYGRDGTTRTALSHNGTLGYQMHKVQEFSFTLSAGATLVMHSDGLATHWKMAQYPGLLAQPPATIAGVLYRDAVRGRDDATVLVARLDAGEAL